MFTVQQEGWNCQERKTTVFLCDRLTVTLHQPEVKLNLKTNQSNWRTIDMWEQETQV